MREEEMLGALIDYKSGVRIQIHKQMKAKSNSGA